MAIAVAANGTRYFYHYAKDELDSTLTNSTLIYAE